MILMYLFSFVIVASSIGLVWAIHQLRKPQDDETE
jgi:cell division protein FtsL